MITSSDTKNFKAVLAFLGILCAVLAIVASPIYAADDTSGTSVSSSDVSTTAPSYTINTFDSSVGADVTQNPEISGNIARTDLSNQVFEYQKSGSSILTFGSGTGNKLLIWSGIHGNEEEANIATMRYMEEIKDKSFDGTLQIIPFAIPRDTAVNSRDYGPVYYYYTDWVKWKKGWSKKAVTKRYKKVYRVNGKRYYKWTYRTVYKRVYGWLYKPVTRLGYNYQDPNRIANVAGTPGNKVLEYARAHGITHILDVHSGGGLSGPTYANGLIYATPGNYEECNWANTIRMQTGAVVEQSAINQGSVRLVGHNYGINTITIEVERDAGSTSHYADVELNMIRSACRAMFAGL
ncbi:MAG: hypothetical protein HZC47_08640 [Methanobacterium sp.]|uniref:hypothetical protein n=1 Tax=Methanobacterium sp. TaxID=2164 RepID=UPI003D646D24|nr:hypothetical protein [Methanobacterium sp.]